MEEHEDDLDPITLREWIAGAALAGLLILICLMTYVLYG